MKIVLNKDPYDSFKVSQEFCNHYNIPYDTYDGHYYQPKEEIARTDLRLIEFIETYGSIRASSVGSYLEVEEIPSGSAYIIVEDGAAESLMLRDKIKWKIAE